MVTYVNGSGIDRPPFPCPLSARFEPQRWEKEVRTQTHETDCHDKQRSFPMAAPFMVIKVRCKTDGWLREA